MGVLRIGVGQLCTSENHECDLSMPGMLLHTMLVRHNVLCRGTLQADEQIYPCFVNLTIYEDGVDSSVFIFAFVQLFSAIFWIVSKELRSLLCTFAKNFRPFPTVFHLSD